MSAEENRVPEAAAAGNAIDGQTAGDGDQGERHVEGSSPEGGNTPGTSAPGGRDAGTPGQPESGRDRDEEKRVYRTPEPEGDHAVGGSKGTADGA